MKTINKLISFFVLSLCFLTTAQAFEGIDYCGNACALNCHTESKICRVDQIITSEEGVFLLVDGFGLGAQGMQAVQEGILVLENGEWMTLEEAVRCDNYYVWQCRACKAWNSEGTSKCYRCKTPRGG